MESKNETHASIADYIRHMADNMPNGVILNIEQCNFIADKAEAAHKREMEHRAIIAGVSLADAVDEEHKREVAELRECLKEAVESYCEWCNDFVGGKQKCEPCECKARKWRKALEGGES